jgi:pyruvate kinase
MLSKLRTPNFNRTKVIATLGPATSSEEVLTKIIEAGVDICRLNFSHGKHEDLVPVIKIIRDINEKYNMHVCLLADLQGPKLRIGEMANGKEEWAPGDRVTFTTEKVAGTKDRVYMTYQQFPADVNVGDKILLDDGKLELRAISTNGKTEVVAEVIYGGTISSKKGVNLPNTKISLPSLTEKDLQDLDFALENNLEWIALSFVRSPEDIRQLREIIKSKGKKARIIAKIEKPEAVQHLDEILQITDAVMVARGDLGVELPMEEVPVIQKTIIKKCLGYSKPVIVATQMMESMITNSRPTRAEANDVANAVMDGADAVMLSAETSVGQFPVEVIQAMDKIISRVEAEHAIYNVRYSLNKLSPTFISDAVCLNAVLMSKEVNAKAIISMTKTGYTAYKLASFRPEAKIFIFSDDPELLNTMNLIWGVRGFIYDKFVSTDETFRDVIRILKEYGHLQEGDLVVNTAAMPIQARSKTNALKISVVD